MIYSKKYNLKNRVIAASLFAGAFILDLSLGFAFERPGIAAMIGLVAGVVLVSIFRLIGKI